MFICILKNIIVAAVLHIWSSFFFFFYLTFKKLRFLVFKFKNGSKLFISSLWIGQLIAKLQSISDESLDLWSMTSKIPSRSLPKNKCCLQCIKRYCFSIKVIKRDHQPLIFRSVEVIEEIFYLDDPSKWFPAIKPWKLNWIWDNFLLSPEVCQWKKVDWDEWEVSESANCFEQICEWWG